MEVGSRRKKPSTVGCVILVLSACSGSLYAETPSLSVKPDGSGIKMSFTREVSETHELEADFNEIWVTPQGNTKYLKIKRMDPAYIDEKILPVSEIPAREILSRHEITAIQSPVAVVDKMIQEANMMAYDNFSEVTRGLLRGKMPANTVIGEADDEYAEDRSYGDRIADSVRSVGRGSWFTVFQVYGHLLDQDPMNDLSGFKSSGYGLQGALLCPAGEEFLFGVYANWQKLKADLRHSDGHIEARGWKVGPTFAWNAGLAHLEGLMTYSWNRVENKVSTVSGEYKNNQWDTYVKGGVDIDMESFVTGLTLTPDLQVLYSSQKREAFDWAYNNKVKGADSSGWTTRLGGTLGYNRLQFEQPLDLKLAAGWQYNQFSSEAMEAERGQRTEIGRYDRHGMYYSAGVDTRINEAVNVSVNYSGLWSSNVLGHYLQAGIEYRF